MASKPLVMLAMPGMGSMPIVSHMSIIELYQRDFVGPHYIRTHVNTNHTLISEARNGLARAFLRATDPPEHPQGRKLTHLLFVDSDMVPPADGLNKLVEADKDIVTGLCTNRSWDARTIIRPEIRKKDAEGNYQLVSDLPNSMDGLKKLKLMEIDACGMAFTLVKREVFEKVPQPWFKFHLDTERKAIFGEDFMFCQAAQSAGFKIWCRVDCVVGHVGTFVYDVSDHWACQEQMETRDDAK